MYRFDPVKLQERMEIYSRYLLALATVMLLTWWLTRRSDPDFGWQQVMLAMVAKIIAGSVYGYFFLHYYGGDDTWMINTDSMAELDKLLNRPSQFFEDLDLFRQVGEFGWKQGLQVFQEKLELAMLIKPLALANLWSKGNYYINVIFFSGICFWSGFWLFKLIKELRPEVNNWVFFLCFLYPPTLFWLSGIRGDGLLFLFFSLTLWQFHQWCTTRRVKNLAWVILGLIGMLVIRMTFGWLLVPALIAWWLVSTQGYSIKTAFIRVYTITLVLFFCSALLPTAFNGPAQVEQRQAQFFLLKGNTRVDLDTLTQNPISYMRSFPGALDNVFLQPYPWTGRGLLQYAMIIQNIFLICMIILGFIRQFPGKQIISGEPVFAVLFCFSLSAYLSIGYTIPFPGALVRYRAIPELCLLLILGIVALGGQNSNYNFFNVYKKKVI